MVFERGEQVFYRGPHVDDSGASYARPVICDVKPVVVVEDSPSLVALYLANGTATLGSWPVPRGRPKPWGPGEWEFRAGTWDRWHTLYLHKPGEWRSTWVMWAPDWRFLGWYVNLQEPLWRTRWGFDIRDLQLDILVAPDRSWRWKDEDDFARSIECGLICAEYAEQTRRSAADAIADVDARAWPFDDSYVNWRPEPGWGMPGLPEGADLEAMLEWSETDSLGRF